MSTLHNEVNAAFERGWKLICLNGKKPVDNSWQSIDTPPAKIMAHNGNLGIRTGKPSGVVVVDLDTAKGCNLNPNDFPSTWTVKTGGGGYHLFFKYPDKEIKNKVGFAPQADIRGDGGQVVMAGSVHPITGNAYAWMEGRTAEDLPLADWAQDVIDRLSTKKDKPKPIVVQTTGGANGDSYYKAALENEVAKVCNAPDGTRNATLNNAALALGHYVGAGHLPRQEVEQALSIAAQTCGLKASEISATIASGLTAGMRQPKSKPASRKSVKAMSLVIGEKGRPVSGEVIDGDTHELDSDTGNASKLARWHKDEIIFNVSSGHWMAWDGMRWRKDADGAAMRCAKEVAKRIGREAWDMNDLEKRKKTIAWALKSEMSEKLSAMLKVAQSVEGMTVMVEKLDADDYLLNCTNGTLDLRTRELRPHNPKDLISKCCNVAYVPDAKAPAFACFIERIFENATDCVPYIQQLFGYCLTGNIRERVFPIFNGGGANGKTTLIEAIAYVMGDYAGVADRSLLQKQMGTPHPANLADLRGLRLASLQEVEDAPMDLARMKTLTGDGDIKAREMYGSFFQFRRTVKVIATTNTPPLIPDQSNAVWSRIQVIPFNEVIPDAEQDKALATKLRKEAEGILAWMVEGCRQWQLEGLKPSNSVKDASASYRDASDPTVGFFEQLLPSQWGDRVPQSKMRKDYESFAKDNGEPILSPRRFKEYAKRHGWHDGAKNNGTRTFEYRG